MSEESASTAETADLPGYAGPVARRRFRRIKLGLLLSSMAACFCVTLLGVVCTLLLSRALGVADASQNYGLLGEKTFLGGVMMGSQLSSYNFILFFITVPAAWLALGFSLGRFPYRGITGQNAYLRWGMVWGAILVGGTTGGFGLLIAPVFALGALIAGGLIGTAAGAVCGFLFYAIVKPANQLADVDVGVF